MVALALLVLTVSLLAKEVRQSPGPTGVRAGCGERKAKTLHEYHYSIRRFTG